MRTLDWFLHRALIDRVGALGAIRRGRLLVSTSLSLAIAVAVGTLLRLRITDVHPSAIAVAFSACVFLVAGPAVLRLSGSLHAAGLMTIAGVIVLSVGTAFTVGGLTAPILMLSPLIPILATLLLDVRTGLVVTLFLLAAVTAFVLLPSWGIEPLPSPITNREEEVAARAMMLSVALVFAALFAILAERGRSEAEAGQERMLAQLERRNTDLERFSFTVSHDLKSPLITIEAYVRKALDEAAAGRLDRVPPHLETISKTVKTLGRQIDGLLAWSRVDRRREAITRLDLSEVARDAAELVRGRAAEQGVTIDIAADLPSVDADPALLRLVFQNLLDNAVKFTVGVDRPRIEVGCRAEDGAIFVADNGRGIRPEDRDRIFELFQKLDPDDGGTGIGLASVRRAVEAHGGTIWVESGDGRPGSTFCFTLPSLPPHA